MFRTEYFFVTIKIRVFLVLQFGYRKNKVSEGIGAYARIYPLSILARSDSMFQGNFYYYKDLFMKEKV
uniref:Uncharacterized protein n=1 Tax=Candidatus Kentrum sp. LPFa TaxID=2126335 RepID=A0A450X8G4_9GAMM|nr:MAG: hypothetical protein BECKLPF1236A_GA0070988_100249 [Candidatus Kentron sp. LPFa]VFK25490.1 MAG: hypothetical protein BECKLPF1236C_GA0070990_1002210 [Candidatus Kentron sp. LPFa]